MVKNALLGLGIAGVMFAVVGNAAAATTTVNVSANITGTCRFNSTPTLAFGALDQTSAAAATASGALSFWCTKNSAYTLTDPDAAAAAYAGTISNGTDSIPYSIVYNNDTGSGGGKTVPVISTLNASIANADYVDAPAGNYTGNVVFTIAP
jgi:spore coat protein U-like protein